VLLRSQFLGVSQQLPGSSEGDLCARKTSTAATSSGATRLCSRATGIGRPGSWPNSEKVSAVQCTSPVSRFSSQPPIWPSRCACCSRRSGALALVGAPPGDHDAVEQRGDAHAEHRCRGQAPPVCGQGLAGEGLRLAGRQDGGGPVEETAGQRRPRVQLQQAGDYVTKPVDTKELLSCMERCCRPETRPRMARVPGDRARPAARPRGGRACAASAIVRRPALLQAPWSPSSQ